MNNNKERIIVTIPSLFFQCFLISLITFGGGSTIIALLQKKFVEKLKWIDESEMLEMVALAQTVPGATSINTTMLIGYKLLGPLGAITCAIASTLPPFLIISIITPFYDQICSNSIATNALRGIRACAAALVMSVSITLSINLYKKKDYFTMLVWLLSMISIIAFKVNVLIIIISGLLIGIIYYFIFIRNKKQVIP